MGKVKYVPCTALPQSVLDLEKTLKGLIGTHCGSNSEVGKALDEMYAELHESLDTMPSLRANPTRKIRVSLESNDGAAFEESATDELARILEEAAVKLRRGVDEFYMYDINGNRCGKAEIVDD